MKKPGKFSTSMHIDETLWDEVEKYVIKHRKAKVTRTWVLESALREFLKISPEPQAQRPPEHEHLHEVLDWLLTSAPEEFPWDQLRSQVVEALQATGRHRDR